MNEPQPPEDFQQAIAATREAEFATLTRAGVPVANPLFHYYREGDASIDVATGLAYPAKADRARANPRVGLLLGPAVHAYDPIAMLEHGPPEAQELDDQPVVVIAALAAVRDGDIQANTDRYVGLFLDEHPKIGPEWDAVKGHLHYWARIWVVCTPVRILYWRAGRTDDEPPQVWEADEGLIPPASDPAPAGRPSARARWPAEDWQDRAGRVLPEFPQPILTAVDSAGFPLPLPVLGAELNGTGFDLRLPRYAPWAAAGSACLSFGALGTFLGELRAGEAGADFRVTRLIGDLPSIFATPQEQLAAMRARLGYELERRGQTMPEVRRLRG